MKQRIQQHPWLIFLILSQLVFCIILGLRWTGYLQSLELDAYDRLLRWRSVSTEADSRIVLIGVTEQDLQTWGWPLSDEILAQLLQRLVQDYRPRVIGLDIYRDRPVGLGAEQLEQIFKNNPIIGIMKFGGQAQKTLQAHHALSADQVGFNDILIDPDGIVRRGLLFLDDGQTSFYSFALRLTLGYLATKNMGLQPDPANPYHVRLGSVTLPPLEANHGGYAQMDAQGYQVLLDFHPATVPFPSFSLSQILKGAVTVQNLRDRIVIIGVTAESVKDFFHTPLKHGLGIDGHDFGIGIHAHLTSQLLGNALDNIEPIRSLHEAWETVWIWLWTVLGGLAGFRLRTLWGFVLTMVLGLTGLGLLDYGLFLQHWWIPLVPPALGWFMAAALVTAYISSQEKAQRAQLMGLFSRYIPRDVAEDLWQQREQFMDGGRPRPQWLIATVLFTDLKGFTSVSEQMEPPVLMDWLNGYMETMAHLVTAHHGVVDKFMGDAIMAVFGVPVARTQEDDIKQDALHALECALAMEAELDRLNTLWKAQNLPAIGMRIGIYTGPLVAGSLGSSERMEYTVIGDTVNTASRLESFDKSLTSERVCRILIGEATLRYLDERFTTRRVGAVDLKGKAEKITVHQVLGRCHSRQEENSS